MSFQCEVIHEDWHTKCRSVVPLSKSPWGVSLELTEIGRVHLRWDSETTKVLQGQGSVSWLTDSVTDRAAYGACVFGMRWLQSCQDSKELNGDSSSL